MPFTRRRERERAVAGGDDRIHRQELVQRRRGWPLQCRCSARPLRLATGRCDLAERRVRGPGSRRKHDARRGHHRRADTQVRFVVHRSPDRPTGDRWPCPNRGPSAASALVECGSIKNRLIGAPAHPTMQCDPAPKARSGRTRCRPPDASAERSLPATRPQISMPRRRRVAVPSTGTAVRAVRQRSHARRRGRCSQSQSTPGRDEQRADRPSNMNQPCQVIPHARGARLSDACGDPVATTTALTEASIANVAHLWMRPSFSPAVRGIGCSARALATPDLSRRRLCCDARP